MSAAAPTAPPGATPAGAALAWTAFVEPAGRPGPENMAVDAWLLDEADRTGAAFLRLYRWTPPCLSFGRHEPALARYDRARIDALGLAVVRRPTGGRAVWHEHEVTYAVAAPVAPFGSLAQSYRAIHARLAAALRRLGADAALAPAARAAGPLRAGPCFAAAAGGEVTIGGRKVVGSAQVRQGGAFLQHGSILLGGDQDLVVRLLAGGPRPGGERPTTLAEALGRPVSFAEVSAAVCAEWGVAGARHAPPAAPAGHRFAEPAWTWRR